MRASRKVVAALLAVAFLTTLFFALTTDRFQPDRACCDHLYYRSMAFNEFSVTRPDLNTPPPGNRLLDNYGTSDHPWLDLRNGLARQPPYAYRVLTPLIAGGLSSLTTLSIDRSFYLISFLALFGAAFVLGLAVLYQTGSAFPAVGTVLVFAALPTSDRLNLNDYMLTDPMAFFLAALAVWALCRRDRALFFIVCLIGVFNKETMVPMLIAYPLSEALIERKVQWISIAAMFAVALAWYLFRLLLPIPVDTYSFLHEFKGVGYSKTVIVQTLIVFGVLLVPLWRAFASKVALSLIPFSAAQVFGGWFIGNIERGVVQAAPFVIMALSAFWPGEVSERYFVLLPAGAYLVQEALSQAGVALRLLLPPLFLAVALGEIALARRWLARPMVWGRR